jgi:hypothetical protein
MVFTQPLQANSRLVPEIGPRSFYSIAVLVKRNSRIYQRNDGPISPTSDFTELFLLIIQAPTWMMFKSVYDTKISNQLLKQQQNLNEIRSLIRNAKFLLLVKRKECYFIFVNLLGR